MSEKLLRQDDVLAVITRPRRPFSLNALVNDIRALPPASPAEVERDERLPSWLDETAAIIRHDGPGGMDQRYCDMVAANLERLADRERALSTPEPEEK